MQIGIAEIYRSVTSVGLRIIWEFRLSIFGWTGTQLHLFPQWSFLSGNKRHTIKFQSLFSCWSAWAYCSVSFGSCVSLVATQNGIHTHTCCMASASQNTWVKPPSGVWPLKLSGVLGMACPAVSQSQTPPNPRWNFCPDPPTPELFDASVSQCTQQPVRSTSALVSR